MIIHEYGLEKMICDDCNTNDYVIADDFNSEIQIAKSEGWKITKPEGQWHHVCPECAQSQSALAQARRRFGLR